MELLSSLISSSYLEELVKRALVKASENKEKSPFSYVVDSIHDTLPDALLEHFNRSDIASYLLNEKDLHQQLISSGIVVVSCETSLI